MKRTIHGEALQERYGGNVLGLRPRRFWYRSVWCPRCHARPYRKCISLPGDYHATKAGRLVDRLRPGSIHRERMDRADLLNDLAKTSPEALYRLAVKPGAHRPPEHQVVDPSRLPLFRAGAGE